MQHSRSTVRWSVLVGGAGLALSAALVLAQQPVGPNSAAAGKGEIAYRRYCASCHGATGRGDGSIAAELRTAPTNLTLISKRNGGRFPLDKVARQTDGRDSIRAHGTPDMPAWGEVFKKTRGTEADTVEDAVMQIAHYLWSIQVK